MEGKGRTRAPYPVSMCAWSTPAARNYLLHFVGSASAGITTFHHLHHNKMARRSVIKIIRSSSDERAKRTIASHAYAYAIVVAVIVVLGVHVSSSPVSGTIVEFACVSCLLATHTHTMATTIPGCQMDGMRWPFSFNCRRIIEKWL